MHINFMIAYFRFLVQVGNGIELEAVGLQFQTYLWLPCGVTWDQSRTVVVIKLRRTPSLFCMFMHIFCIFLHIYAIEVNVWGKCIYLHTFAYFLHICAIFFTYFCIYMHMHILAYNAYQDIYLAYSAYFRNAYLCIFSFAYICMFFAYKCIWIFAINAYL